MRKREKKPEGGADWMGTYGDMVTLLLCFFVMLYSMSSVDQQKWEMVVKSLNPGAKEVSQIVTDMEAQDGTFDVSGSMPKPEVVEEPFDELYYTLKKAVEAQGLESSIEVTKGDGFTFILFRDKVVFDGESSVLRPEGKQILDGFAAALGAASSAIQEIQILGHTSMNAPGYPNDIYNDRMLAANRSTEVLTYIAAKGIIEPAKLVQSSFGQYRPVATHETAEGRASNRRVEMIITKNGAVNKSLDEYYDQVYGPNK